MRRKYGPVILCVLSIMISGVSVKAQMPIAEVIQQGVKKVILAVDLKVQRLQNKTVWLQNAQKEMENVLSKAELSDISGWVQKQKDLYGDYFAELWKVKEAIGLYHRVKEIGEKQVMMVNTYKGAFRLFRQDTHFTPDELVYMTNVYTGMIDESLKNVDGLLLAVSPGTTQMSDADRLDLINSAGDAMDRNYNDLQEFTNESKLLSLKRSKDEKEAVVIKALYGLQ